MEVKAGIKMIEKEAKVKVKIGEEEIERLARARKIARGGDE
jgi:hypothetical protein